MKKRMLWGLIGISSLLFPACKKDANKSTTIVGTWELGAIYTGNTVADLAPGYGNLIQFTDARYKAYRNGIQVKNGLYILVDDSSAATTLCLPVPLSYTVRRLIYNGDYDAKKEFIHMGGDGNALTLMTGCDSVFEYFRR